jgi:UDP-glucose 4-epimerase
VKYLVTGGAGFIGSNLVDELVSKGHEVVIIDNESAESNSEFYWNKNAKKYLNDINDFSSLNSIFSKEKPDMVFHLAAEARIQPTINEPHKACLTNFVGTCNVLQASKENGVKRVIYSSTSSAYGLKNTPPLKEDMSKDCLTPYSVSKTAGEELCKVYYKIYGLETVILRYFNAYGNREPIKGPYAPVVGLFIRQKKEGKPFTIVGDGQQTRDFTHIDDVVAANVLSATTENEKAFGEIFNIGTGESHSILWIAHTIGGDFTYLPARSGEARHTMADNYKAREILDWKPKKGLKTYLKNIDF